MFIYITVESSSAVLQQAGLEETSLEIKKMNIIRNINQI